MQVCNTTNRLFNPEAYKTPTTSHSTLKAYHSYIIIKLIGMESIPMDKELNSMPVNSGSLALKSPFPQRFTIKYGDTALTSIEAAIEFEKNARKTCTTEQYKEIRIMGGQQIAELGDLADAALAKYFDFHKSDSDWDRFRKTQEYNANWKRLAERKKNAQHNQESVNAACTIVEKNWGEIGNTPVPLHAGIAYATTEKVHNLKQVQQRMPCSDQDYSNQEYPTSKQQTVPGPLADDNNKEEGIGEKNAPIRENNNTLQLHLDDDARGNEEEDDEEDENNDKQEGNNKEDSQAEQLVLDKRAQVAHADDSEEGKKQKLYDEVFYIRHHLHKGFLLRGQPPKEEDMGQMSFFMQKLESYDTLPASIIKSTKIIKVLVHLFRLTSIPKDKKYNFHDRTFKIIIKFRDIIRQSNAKDLYLCPDKDCTSSSSGLSHQVDKNAHTNQEKTYTPSCNNESQLPDENEDSSLTASLKDKSQLGEAVKANANQGQNKDYTPSYDDESQLSDENGNGTSIAFLKEKSQFGEAGNAHTNQGQENDCTPLCNDKSQLPDGNGYGSSTTSPKEKFQLGKAKNAHTNQDKDCTSPESPEDKSQLGDAENGHISPYEASLHPNHTKLDKQQTKDNASSPFTYTPVEPVEINNPDTNVPIILNDLAMRLGCSQTILADKGLHSQGITVIPSLMDYWFEPIDDEGMSMFDIAVVETDIFYYHSYNKPASDGYLWLQRYSISQQMLWQDPFVYVLMHCLLNGHPLHIHPYPDAVHHLHSAQTEHWQSPKKFVSENTPKEYLSEGKLGVADHLVLQLPLHVESEHKCVDIVEGAHHAIYEFNFPTPGPFYITTTHIEELGCKTVQSICNSGGVRVLHPLAAYGLHGKGDRLSLSASFIGVDENGVDLLVAGMPDQASFVSALSHMELPSKAPRDIYEYEAPLDSYKKFPASFLVDGPSAIGMAVAGRRPWNDALVKMEQDILLGKNRSRAWDFVYNIRKDMQRTLLRSWKQLKTLEMRAFGLESYFRIGEAKDWQYPTAAARLDMVDTDEQWQRKQSMDDNGDGSEQDRKHLKLSN
ncbi:hypothetical protein FQN50_010007 [Emmonsiellopsis sp. PD_5]|nr:hypothetical protein FQN50_010007 [Emmonsiellopsis sp. PD_5]